MTNRPGQSRRPSFIEALANVLVRDPTTGTQIGVEVKTSWLDIIF
jgi:hypothetical protein